MLLKGKHILVGITGGIAAYKSASLIRLFVKNGAEVKVVMTANAKHFITPLTLATLCKNPINVEFFNPENGEWNSHISLGEWADMFVIAPATASTMAKMAHGVADNLLVTTYLSSRCPVAVAPAMDLDMYAHITTTNNLKTLSEHGVHIVEPNDGFLASGLIGKGRMAEPEQIYQFVEEFFTKDKPLKGKKAMLTVGGSVEMIDSVRCITNSSTGKMGYAVASALKEAGADVTIIRASVDGSLIGSIPGVNEIVAMSAEDMYNEVVLHKDNQDVVVMAAAVADFTPKNKFDYKLKKGDKQTLTIELESTKDIAAEIGKTKSGSQCFVGFALESDNETVNALSKLERKNFDLIVLNSLKDGGAGFAFDTNKITIFDKSGNSYPYSLKSKKDVAVDIVSHITNFFTKL